MTDRPDGTWARGLAAVPGARETWTAQLAAHWFADDAWARTRDDLDLALFRAMLRGPGAAVVRRLMLYEPPSDLGGAPVGHQRAKVGHDGWLARVRRQLAALGAPSSATDDADRDYRVRLVILPRAGRRPTIDVPDGIWIDEPPPPGIRSAWEAPALIWLDPHEENIIGPHGDRNPLWAGNVT